jgi:predicted nucleic acid-binding protein
LIVLDSSAAVDYLVGTDPLGGWVEACITADDDLHAPYVVDVEVVGAIRRLVLTGEVAKTVARKALEDLEALDLRRYPHLPFVPRMWQLRENVRAADACFVALAEALDATLVTTDSRLAAAPGVRARILAP